MATPRVRELEAELALARRRLSSLASRYETSFEKVTIANETLRRRNRELERLGREHSERNEHLSSEADRLRAILAEEQETIDVLERRAADLRSLMDAAGAATLLLDPDLRILRYTARIAELFHLREADRGRPVSELAHRLDYPDLLSDARRVLDEDGSIEREVPDDRGRWYFVRVAAHRADGAPSADAPADGPPSEGVVFVLVEVTRRKQLEDRLRQAEKMEAIGQLAGGVAHDLNNLLTVQRGSLSVLRERLGEELALAAVDEVERATDRAAVLTRQLTAFSRKQRLDERELDLPALVADTRDLLTRVVPERIEFRTDVAHDRLYVRADPTQLDQVILNLVANAVDAIPGGGTVVVSVDAAELTPADAREIPWEIDPGRYVRLSVSDTGVGMDTETAGRALEPFYTTKPRGQGTGLGLASVFGIVKQSDGHLFIDSAPGQGTTVRVLLPRRKGPGGAGSSPVREPAGGTARETADGNANETADEGESEPPAARGILLVEDDDAVRRVARRTLERAGHTVAEATTGAEALDMARELGSRIELVVSDIVMPEMNGIELYRRLARQRPDLAVVLMSGYSENEIHGDVHDTGAVFLAKPFTPEQLLRGVADALAANRPGQ
jgi:signal transduction histidine kinase/ActR/RegA family two-component response regulator